MVRVARMSVEIGHCHCATATRTIDDADRHIGQPSFLEDALYSPAHPVLRSAGTRSNHNFDRLSRFPRLRV
jgi:hypothetical protein